MSIYAGLDVSDKTTHICVVDVDGTRLAIEAGVMDDSVDRADRIDLVGDRSRIGEEAQIPRHDRGRPGDVRLQRACALWGFARVG